MKAQKCPVCYGSGEIKNDNYSTSGCGWHKTCHGCNGKGWVEVSESHSFNMPKDLEQDAIRLSRKTIFN